MNYYLDLTLLADSDVNLGFIWQKVYQQIHLMLVENKVGEHDSAIAVSFPHYGDKTFPLGNKLRLFGPTQTVLEELNVAKWLARLEDYVHIKAIKPVPDNVEQFVLFTRKQFKSPAKLRENIDTNAKKLADKNGFEVDEVKERLSASLDKFDTESKLPYINMTSLSTETNSTMVQQSSFKLFIEKQSAEKQDGTKLFTCYGLSRREQAKQACVPWFK
ncbi:type I-F CRISPR-associated endoribonuclease Cas6/Csy4 [Methylophaga thalassica]|uniref:type I-F CRISPR-associated endoribonuclease Cas6/Csy4 n=1 Tax=Methylophaga thalassica TaxID=40223 RepID=UPI002E7AF520|nr:type I-F CRISPR-associated endoribonuclease Cas6/Csy4 [Methylophaga thalassica]WVI86635.1 type I-F CRISPR-associated endoribonuclease Cas6/Csy4 [Methylophaga thalassica]